MSESSEQSLASNWQKGLHTNFDKASIHEMIAAKYDAGEMVREYKKYFYHAEKIT